MPATEIAIAIVEHAGRFLIGLRPDGAPLAGFWEFPGGKLRAGETLAEAAARECLEETGLAVDVIAEQAVVDHAYEHGAIRLHFFRCRLRDSAHKPAPRFRWVTAAELGGYRFPPANAAVVSALMPAGS